MCLCVGNESISFTLVSLPNRDGREGASRIGCLSISSLSCSLTLFSHMLVAVCRYCSPSRLSHTHQFSVFVSHLCILTLYLPWQIFDCLPFHSHFLWLVSVILSIFIFHLHSLRFQFNLLVTHSFSIHLAWLHLSFSVSFIAYETHCESQKIFLRLCN